MLEEFIRRWDGEAEYVEKSTHNMMEELLAIGKNEEFGLVIVGRGRFPATMVAGILEREAERSLELGVIGDLLAFSGGQEIASSVLVVQKHEQAKEDQERTMFDQHLV